MENLTRLYNYNEADQDFDRRLSELEKRTLEDMAGELSALRVELEEGLQGASSALEAGLEGERQARAQAMAREASARGDAIQEAIALEVEARNSAIAAERDAHAQHDVQIERNLRDLREEVEKLRDEIPRGLLVRAETGEGLFQLSVTEAGELILSRVEA
ncbi:MAG: hypothetical protein IJ083_15160 [Clostridia bacterium]|nr:hypothetical protein [Clostridia bacterium]